MLIQSSSVLTVSGVDFSVGMCLIIMPQTLRRTESPADRFHAEPVPVWNSKRHRALTTQHIYNTINSITHLNRGHLGNKRAGDRQWNHQELCCNKKRNKILFLNICLFLLTIKPSLMSNLASSGGCDFIPQNILNIQNTQTVSQNPLSLVYSYWLLPFITL